MYIEFVWVPFFRLLQIGSIRSVLFLSRYDWFSVESVLLCLRLSHSVPICIHCFIVKYLTFSLVGRSANIVAFICAYSCFFGLRVYVCVLARASARAPPMKHTFEMREMQFWSLCCHHQFACVGCIAQCAYFQFSWICLITSCVYVGCCRC